MVTIPPLGFTWDDQDKQRTRPAIPNSQATNFLNLLTANIAKVAEKKGYPSPDLRAPAQPAVPRGVITPAHTEEGGMKEVFRFVFSHEGSDYVAEDGGKESSRYGILQSTANRYGFRGSVKNMSRPDAEAIYTRIWKESGAASLPRDLALVHFDTYMNSPAAARKMLKSSGGDVNVYLDLRSKRYVRLSTLKPARYARYVKGWMTRIGDLRNLVAENSAVSTKKLQRGYG